MTVLEEKYASVPLSLSLTLARISPELNPGLECLTIVPKKTKPALCVIICLMNGYTYTTHLAGSGKRLVLH